MKVKVESFPHFFEITLEFTPENEEDVKALEKLINLFFYASNGKASIMGIELDKVKAVLRRAGNKVFLIITEEGM